MGERLHRELQCPPARRTAQRRGLLHATRSQNRHRELAPSLQRRSAACFSRLQTTSTGGLRARAHSVAGCATSTSSAGHAGATAIFQLTFHLGHSMKATHSRTASPSCGSTHQGPLGQARGSSSAGGSPGSAPPARCKKTTRPDPQMLPACHLRRFVIETKSSTYRRGDRFFSGQLASPTLRSMQLKRTEGRGAHGLP